MANAQIIVDFVANLTGLSKAASDVEKTGKTASKGLSWQGVAKFAGAAAGLAGVGKILVDSTQKTADLAKATAGLQRATGLDTKTASEWVLLLQQRGQSADGFAKAMLGLSKAMETWRAKGEGASSPLKDLGVSFDAVQKGDIGAVLAQVADGLAKIENPAQKAALASKLFGKNGAALLPILGKGSEAMQKQLDATDKYGAALDGKALTAVQDQTKAQRELKDMQAGLASVIGTAVIPVQAEAFGLLVKTLGPVTELLTSYGLMTPIILGLAAAYGTYKAAQMAASIAGSKDLIVTIAKTTWKGAEAVATWAVTAAQWAYNAAMIAGLGPILLVVAAIVALIAIGILVWKNWDKISAGLSKAFAAIKNAAFAVWNWIKANWPLLLAILTGPIGIAVLILQRNWDTITGAVRAAVDTIKRLLGSLRDWLGGVVSSIGSKLSQLADLFSKPGDAARDAYGRVKDWLGKIPGAIEAIVGRVRNAANSVASALKGPINAVVSGWNGLRIPSFSVGGGKILGQSIPKVTLGPYDLPDMPHLARGGVLTRPTLFVGGEAGREIVTPENLLRDILEETGGRGDTFQLYLQPRTADAADIAYGFRRLELLRTGR